MQEMKDDATEQRNYGGGGGGVGWLQISPLYIYQPDSDSLGRSRNVRQVLLQELLPHPKQFGVYIRRHRIGQVDVLHQRPPALPARGSPPLQRGALGPQRLDRRHA